MRRIKLKQGVSKVYRLDRKSFEELTEKDKPYYQEGHDYPYAVCPQCDNPVKIIGFYKKIKRDPYAEHHKEDIIGLATFDLAAYELCLYSGKRRDTSNDSIPFIENPHADRIKDALKSQYDRIVYILGQKIGIWISDQLAEDMLKTFCVSTQWHYPWATLNNLPWMLFYLSGARHLCGRLIKEDSALYEAIKQKGKRLYFTETSKHGYVQLQSEGYSDVSACFIHHDSKTVDEEAVETIRFVVTQTVNGENIELLNRVLEIDETYFLNLVCDPDGENKRYRKEKLLEIAERCLK